MADYKVVDAQQLDGDLTVLADAIRERAGSEGKMAFPHGIAQTVKSIPTGGVELPTLENPVTEAEVFLGKEYIDGNGQMATGSFTIDDELMEQDSLISQITTALRNKAAGSLITLPELGDTAAQPTDMVLGKVLYDDQGNPVIGTVKETTLVCSMSSAGVYRTTGRLFNPSIKRFIKCFFFFAIVSIPISFNHFKEAFRLAIAIILGLPNSKLDG